MNRQLKRITALCSSAALLLGIGLVGAAPAVQASDCSNKTGGNNHWVMWTGTRYTCAYQAKSGKKKIGSGNSQSWTNSTAKGYERRDSRKKQTGDVTVTYIYTNSGGSGVGSSITYSAMNFGSGSRHWGAAVIWNTSSAGKVDSSQFKGDNYEYKTNRFLVSKISVTAPSKVTEGQSAQFTVQVKDPDGGSTPTGGVALMRQVGKDPDPPKKDCSGKSKGGADEPYSQQVALSGGKATLVSKPLTAGSYKFYAVYTGTPLTSDKLPGYCLKPSQQGLTGAQSGTYTVDATASASTKSLKQRSLSEFQNLAVPAVETAQTRGEVRPFRLAVVNRTYVTRSNGGAAGQRLVCPRGWLPMQINAASPTQVLPENLLATKKGKVALRKGMLPRRTTVNVQAVCRAKNAPVQSVGRGIYGSRFSDNIVTKRAGSSVFGGLGNDRIIVRNSKAVGFGGVGNDRITVTSRSGAAVGGPGNDYLQARKSGKVLLVGGIGKDTLVGAKGRTLINAVDGRGGDVVYCKSKKNRVYADKGDKLIGPCKRVKLRM